MNKDQFKAQVLKNYERGRWIAAAKYLWFVIPILIIALCTCGNADVPLCTAFLLVVAVILLKWRGEEFGSGVGPGLIAGAVAFFIPLTLHLLGICCQGNLEILFCGISGSLGGAMLGIHFGKSKRPNKMKALAFAILVASLTAALGCAALGIGATLGLMGSLVLVSILAFTFKKSQS